MCTQLGITPVFGSILLLLVYSTICHDKCDIAGVAEGVTGDKRLKRCAAMGKTRKGVHPRCNQEKCGCPWFEHMHQRFDTEVESMLCEDPKILADMEAAKTAQGKAEVMERATKAELKEWRDAEATITKDSARFAVFLKENGIIAVNDAREKYLEMLIQKKKREEASTEAIDSLERTKVAYVKQRRVIEDTVKAAQANPHAVTATKNELSATKMDEYVQELYQLPCGMGEHIKKMVEAGNQAMENLSFRTELSLDAVAHSLLRKKLRKRTGSRKEQGLIRSVKGKLKSLIYLLCH